MWMYWFATWECFPFGYVQHEQWSSSNKPTNQHNKKTNELLQFDHDTNNSQNEKSTNQKPFQNISKRTNECLVSFWFEMVKQTLARSTRKLTVHPPYMHCKEQRATSNQRQNKLKSCTLNAGHTFIKYTL